MKVSTITATGATGSATLSDELFAGSVNSQLLAQAVRVFQSNQRQGGGAAQTRATISRTKKKWYRQKGTGNARHGARSAPIFVGGGLAHGPKTEQNWKRSLSAKMKKQALLAALRAQLAADNLQLGKFLEVFDGKTKTAAQFFAKVGLEEGRVLLVVAEKTEQVMRSVRNLPQVLLVSAQQLSAYEVAVAHAVILDQAAVSVLEERLQIMKKTTGVTLAKTTSVGNSDSTKKTKKK